MLRNLATSIILYEKVKTTEIKAKAVRPLIEKMIQIGKRKNTTATRKLNKFFLDKNASKKIKEDLVERFGKRKSGYMRMTRLGPRSGDGAPMMQVELILPERIDKEKITDRKKISRGVTTRIKTKSDVKSSGAKVKVIKKDQKEEITKKTTRVKMEKVKVKKPKVAPIGKKKGWLDRVSDTQIGKRVTDATKKVWRRRTTSK